MHTITLFLQEGLLYSGGCANLGGRSHRGTTVFVEAMAMATSDSNQEHAGGRRRKEVTSTSTGNEATRITASDSQAQPLEAGRSIGRDWVGFI